MAGFFKPEALDDPDVCNLSDNAHRLWLVLCVQPNPRCGIFKPNWRVLSARSRTPFEAMPDCLAEFVALGWVKVDEASGYIWIVNYTKHQSKQKFWLAGAFEEVKGLAGKTMLADEFLSHYADSKPDISANSNLKSAKKSAPKSALISAQKSVLVSGCTGQDRTDSTEQTETPLPPTGGNGAIAPAGRTGRTAKPESAEDVKSARLIEAYIADKIEKNNTKHGALDNSDYETCAREIRLLREKDGIDITAIRKTLDYAWAKSMPGGQLYGEVLLSVKKWRKDGKFNRAYEQAMNQRDTSASDYTRTSYTPAGPPVDFDNPSIVWDRPSKAVRGE